MLQSSSTEHKINWNSNQSSTIKLCRALISLSQVIQYAQASETEPLAIPKMIQNIFSNIQSALVKNQQQRNVSTTWQGALVVVAVVGIPWCLCMGVLAVRAQALAAGRVEAKNLGRGLSNSSDLTQEEEEQQDNNNKKEEDISNTEEVVDATSTSIKEAIEQQLDEYAAPLHLNMRLSARLKGNSSSQSSGRSRVMSRSSSRGSSRSASPAPELQSHSSSSSLAEELAVPLDMLTDRKGFEELEPLPPHTMVVLSKLPAVSERLSEETLEDVHAFCDLTAGNNSTRSIQNIPASSDNSYLETLDEEGDSFDDNDGGESSPVVSTIMEEGSTTQVVFDLLDSKTSTSATAQAPTNTTEQVQ